MKQAELARQLAPRKVIPKATNPFTANMPITMTDPRYGEFKPERSWTVKLIINPTDGMLYAYWCRPGRDLGLKGAQMVGQSYQFKVDKGGLTFNKVKKQLEGLLVDLRNKEDRTTALGFVKFDLTHENFESNVGFFIALERWLEQRFPKKGQGIRIQWDSPSV